jgi:hypothetical protein
MMAISEARLQLLVPREFKRAVQRHAGRLGLSVGEYIRRLIKKDLPPQKPQHARARFPFGENPIHTGRTRGSVDHDRF